MLRGEGASRTRLLVDQGAWAAIQIIGDTDGRQTDIVGGHSRGSSVLNLTDTGGFVVGTYADIRQDNDPAVMYTDPRWNQPWGADAVGQIVKIVAVVGNNVTIEEPLRLNLQSRLRPRIRAQRFVENAGIERLHLVRRDRSDQHMIYFRATAYSWVREVESEYAYRSHVAVDESYRCEVRDSYIHHAGDYGGGGHGYGTQLTNRTAGCLVVNNVFSVLRHAMIVATGATGNVFGYNYSRENRQNEGERPLADISLHGNYPNYNLFEGNVVQLIYNSDFWGPSGPGNTLFRNRVESFLQPPMWGIRIDDHSHGQNVVGNEVVLGTISIDRTVRDTLIHGNLVRGTMTWDPTISDRDLPTSYYLTARPSFYGATPWPSSGADRPSGTNPAKERYGRGEPLPRR